MRILGWIVKFPACNGLDGHSDQNRAEVLCKIEYGSKPGPSFDWWSYDREIWMHIRLQKDYDRFLRILNAYNDKVGVHYKIPWVLVHAPDFHYESKGMKP